VGLAVTDVGETSADTAASDSGLGTIDTRREQMFPKFSPDQIDRKRRYSEVKRYTAGDVLSRIGDTAPGALVLLEGRARVEHDDPLGHSKTIAEIGPGDFIAEVAQLSGGPSLIDARAHRHRGAVDFSGPLAPR
jgi:thioredoxin reductase (NADPH)